eukprot:TRINITY_DN36986_c0_g1_i1.p1 TRINITY_DN36986_c0_g1~~TRINITY_DN36986_c0_g1_i1.p1  ORF type:complete len:413 (+),score=48.74 TRINITY_DN36986_c0_g1_i1:61-1239(+)
MALRRSGLTLSSGGGLSPGLGLSQGGDMKRNRAWFSPRFKAENMGNSSSHRAGYNTKCPWSTKTTMAYHMMDQPDWKLWGYKQHIYIEDEIPQLTAHSPMTPLLFKQAYEQWKVENKAEVAQHAGKYAIVTAEGIVKTYTPKEMQATQVELTASQWVDYIQPGYGTVDITEDLTRWNSTLFEDIDEVKQWCNFEERDSWSKAPSTTPVSARITGNPADAPRVVKQPLSRENAREKWLTFTSTYGYGSEQFSPTHATVSPAIRDQTSYQKYQPKVIGMDRTAIVRDFIPNTNYFRPASHRRGTPFKWVKQINKKVATVHKVHPSGREVWLGPNSSTLTALKRRAIHRPGGDKLLNLLFLSSYGPGIYNVNNQMIQQNSKRYGFRGYSAKKFAK